MISRPPIGLYIHVPFCVKKCPYCDFYSLPFSPSLADRYTDAVVRAIHSQPYGEQRSDTVYFGGGTPALLGARRLCRILDEAKTAFSIPDDREITLEANPGVLTQAECNHLVAGGFNRISLGVQSLEPSELRHLGRIHSPQQAVAGIQTAYDAGFAHISADVMLATPGQTLAGLENTLSTLMELPVDHISAYLLKIEEGTPFAQGEMERLCPDEAATEQLYLSCVDILQSNGFYQYEISNFAKADCASRHNLKYWRCQPYLGLGPSAHSFMNGMRAYFPNDLHAFLDVDDPFHLLVEDGPGGGWEEYAMLHLRLKEGLHLPELHALHGIETAPIRGRAAALAARGLLHLENDRISLTPAGFLLSNSITGHLLY